VSIIVETLAFCINALCVLNYIMIVKYSQDAGRGLTLM